MLKKIEECDNIILVKKLTKEDTIYEREKRANKKKEI